MDHVRHAAGRDDRSASVRVCQGADSARLRADRTATGSHVPRPGRARPAKHLQIRRLHPANGRSARLLRRPGPEAHRHRGRCVRQRKRGQASGLRRNRRRAQTRSAVRQGIQPGVPASAVPGHCAARFGAVPVAALPRDQRAHDGPVRRPGDDLQVVLGLGGRDLVDRGLLRSVQRSDGAHRVRGVRPGAGQHHRVPHPEAHVRQAQQQPGQCGGELRLGEPDVPAERRLDVHGRQRQPTGHRPPAAHAALPQLVALLQASDADRRKQARQFAVLPAQVPGEERVRHASDAPRNVDTGPYRGYGCRQQLKHG